MTNWRDHILKEFPPRVERLTVVADPDGLLLEEKILEGIRDRGFELLPFDDHIEFRYAYESRFRSRWDRGDQTDLVVVLRSDANDLSTLPYDLLHAGRKLSFSLGDIFPNLSYPVVATLYRGYLDVLYNAQKRHSPGNLGENATKEFILRHVFEIAPELIKQPSDLLRVFLRLHYHGQQIPVVLTERLIQLLRKSNHFDDWPLETLTLDREAFYGFLQERWPIFLSHMTAHGASIAEDDTGTYNLAVKGPTNLPFDHHDIRGYVESIFLEGFLQPVSPENKDVLSKTWMSIGVKTHASENKSLKLAKLVNNLGSSVPKEDAKYTDWFHFTRGWAEMIVISSDGEVHSHGEVNNNIKHLKGQVDAAFTKWIVKRYAGLINLPPAPPVMLHHLPRYLARQLADDSISKVALLVVDGLSLDQWIIIREELALQKPDYCFRDSMVFAWVPSTTPVSRQAIFAGKPPIFFPDSIYSTDKEPMLWTQFWTDQGFMPGEVVYGKGLGDGSLDDIFEALSHPQVKIAGLVVDKVDKIMHGMELGTAGMHNQVRQWAQQLYLCSLIDMLLDKGFHVFLTSDHGNIEAEGCGRPAEGVVADLRGERVRIYPDVSLRASVKEHFLDAMEWNPTGLPEDYLPLIAPPRKVFVNENERTVSHGGISVEELIVPLVQIERKAL